MSGKLIEYGAQRSSNVAMLTWIRGFAAFIVIVSHVRQATWVDYGGESFDYSQGLPLLYSFFSMGNFGVSLFFVLSGCTLYLGYHRLQGTREASAFYMRRLARIYPAFFVALLCYWMFREIFQRLYGMPVGNWVENQFLADFDLPELLQYLTLTANFRMEEAIFNNAFWSLPVEFQFYLLFPLLLLLHRAINVVSLVLLGGILYVLSVVLDLLEFYTMSMLWQFAGGMLCAHFYLRKPLNIGYRSGFILLLVFYSLLHLPKPDIPGIYGDTYNGIVAVLMVAVCVNMELPRFNNSLPRFFNWQGEISYSVYLFHNLFIGAWLLVALKLELSGWNRLALIGIGTVICTYALAHISYQFVEKPGIEAGRRFAKNIKNRQSAAVLPQSG